MDIHLAGSRPTRRAPKEYFTGTVWQDPIIATAAPARLASTRVAFEPGARTAWHTHPKGQTLYAIVMEHESLSLIFYSIFYRFFYVLIIDVCKVFATLEELVGLDMSWGKLARKGRI